MKIFLIKLRDGTEIIIESTSIPSSSYDIQAREAIYEGYGEFFCFAKDVLYIKQLDAAKQA